MELQICIIEVHNDDEDDDANDNESHRLRINKHHVNYTWQTQTY